MDDFTQSLLSQKAPPASAGVPPIVTRDQVASPSRASADQAQSSDKSEGERIIELLQFIEVEMRRTRKECEAVAASSRKSASGIQGLSIMIAIFFLCVFVGGVVVVIK
jgi:hypothetical protein